MYLQGYLAWARGVDELVGKLGLGEKDTQRARFAVSLVTDAFAPSNMPWANPIALKRLVESGGASLLQGLENMMQDLFNNQGMPAQVDKSKFQVGKNLGTSPGAVIFRNPVLELIQYKPTTGSVLARPLARRSRLGRGHQYACGPFPSRSQLLSPSAMSGLPKPSMLRRKMAGPPGRG